jgi:arylsulfatase A-like enzyme
MNLVFVTLDSLNRHFLTAYGNPTVRTPNLTDFANRACVFDNHYVGSVPCMPARREMWPGTQEMWWRWWGPLEPWDLTVPYVARQAGVDNSMLLTDHYHSFEWGSHGYHEDFSGCQFIRSLRN